MKKALLLLFLLIISASCSQKKESINTSDSTLYTSSTDSENENAKRESEYNRAVSTFTKINSTEYYKKTKNNDNFFVYFGRVTCPDCLDTISELKQSVKKQDIEMFYIDTDTEEKDLDISEIRRKENINFVPSILYLEKGKAKNLFTPDDNNINQFIIDQKNSEKFSVKNKNKLNNK